MKQWAHGEVQWPREGKLADGLSVQRSSSDFGETPGTPRLNRKDIMIIYGRNLGRWTKENQKDCGNEPMRARGRLSKRNVCEVHKVKEPQEALDALYGYPDRQVVNPCCALAPAIRTYAKPSWNPTGQSRCDFPSVRCSWEQAIVSTVSFRR
jgi:hypothetical protein